MIIEKRDRITKEEAREITILMANARQLLKNPEKKPSDVFSFCIKISIFGIIGLILCAVFIAFEGVDAYDLSCIIVLSAMMVITFVFYRSMRKIYLEMLNRGETHVTVTLDEDGVDYDDHGDKKIKLSWKSLLFFRKFQKTACFFPKDLSGIMITLGAEDFDQIKEFLSENNVNLRIIE